MAKPYEFAKHKLLELFRYNLQPRFEALHAEQTYQGIFAQQCRARGIDEVFYPVGAAASYSLLYLLTRVMSELPVKTVLEMGSGQSTVLIDHLLPEGGSHLAYEQDADWAQRVGARVKRSQVRHSPLASLSHEGQAWHGLSGVQPQAFDLLLVDGPNGTDPLSRFDCVPLVAAHPGSEFIVVIDDADRPGEQETIAVLQRVLKQRGLDFKLNYLHGRNTQAVITTPRYRAASYFF
jgi:predicted O-methyltransferase YrrM